MKKALLVFIFLVFACPVYGEIYTWVDDRGTVHFTDDVLNIPEKYRPDAQSRKTPKEVFLPKIEGIRPAQAPAPGPSEPVGFEVPLKRSGGVWTTEVVLNGRLKQRFILDTGASFTNISYRAAKELDIRLDENTPFLPVITASDVILNPLVTLKSLRAGKAEVENVDVLIHDLPGDTAGLLGNTFLSKFKVVLDSSREKMTLFPMESRPSPDRPGGYEKDYWMGRFRFYHHVLEELKKMRLNYGRKEARSELARVDNAIRYFENQLSDLDRRASFAGVPRNWRQ